MMMDNRIELVFVLDKSGSMSGLESDTIGGFNALIKKQAKEPGDVRVTTILFNQGLELLHDRIPLKGVSPMSELDYEVGGSTALLDAIGAAIQKIGNAQKRSFKEERASKVMVVITTDGMENASKEFTYAKIKQMIARQKGLFSWEFIFLGANIDAVETAKKFGIAEEFAAEYHADSIGTELNYTVLNEAVSSFRKEQQLTSGWKRDIETDFEKRKRQ